MAKKKEKCGVSNRFPRVATGAEVPDGARPHRAVSSAPRSQAICLVMGTVVTPEMTERPQEALFAEAAASVASVDGWDT